MVTVADIISRFLGCILILSCILFHMHPVGGRFLVTRALHLLFDASSPLAAHFFGITNANSETAVFMPALGARHAAFGILVLSLSYNGEKKAIGMLWVTFTIVGLVDARICWLYGEKWLLHFVATGVVLVLGTMLLLGY
ncbi:hypothetical protein DL96DRAFT_1115937 [Flagelloscypha sp. PMI_526]|nr:hypothetical protein DL96DRAFT_1115937 [Flagelloscypha sp. PMI_526]